ncbi:hypothetical protein [Oceanithermus sp.]
MSALLEPEAGAKYACAPNEQVLSDYRLSTIINLATENWPGLQLDEIYRSPLLQARAVVYRQGVLRELSRPGLNQAARDFLLALRWSRRALKQAEKSYDSLPRAWWRLEAFRRYLQAGRSWLEATEVQQPQAAGLRSALSSLRNYLDSPALAQLSAEAEEIAADLRRLSYRLRVQDSRISVYPAVEGRDFATAIRQVFSSFDQQEESHRFSFGPRSGMTSIEVQALEAVAELYPDVFARLREFTAGNGGIFAPVVLELERGLAFYLSWQDLTEPLRQAGLQFTFPQVEKVEHSQVNKGIELSLALEMLPRGSLPVSNDFSFDRAQVLLVTGPNQAGKTTYARMVGQLSYLAALGFDLPAAGARVKLPQVYLSHFPQRERAEDLRSRLENDLIRFRDLLRQARPGGLAVLNEPFASAMEGDALEISRRLMGKLRESGVESVWVSFLDDLVFEPGVASLVAQVDPVEPTRRTYRIVPAPPQGQAYTQALLRKYHLLPEDIEEMLG